MFKVNLGSKMILHQMVPVSGGKRQATENALGFSLDRDNSMPKEMEALSHAQRYLVPKELHVNNSLTYQK